MRREFFGGGMYCDNLPSGEFAVYMGGSIQTHLGVIDSPELLFVRITNQPHFRIAAKTQSPGNVIVWDGQWIDDPRISNGVQGHIWRNGVLEVIEPGEHKESQGYRYVAPDGSLVEGSPTYNPDTSLARALGVKRLYAWTRLGDGVFVGQGDTGGVVFQKADKHYVLIEGHWEFVQAKRDGDTIAIAAYETKRTEARLWWLSASEIDALPVLPPVNGPDPQPDPQPEPEPQPVPDLPESLLPTVERIWTKYGGQNRGAMLNEIAWEHRAKGWGLSRKTSGHFVESPVGQVASDILHHKPSDTIWDVFTDTGVIWAQAEHHNNPDRPWVAPVAPAGPQPDPGPDPVPIPQPDTLTPRVEALERQVAALKAEHAAWINDFAQMDVRVTALENKPEPVFKLPRLRVDGRSRSSFGHQHHVDLEVKVIE